MKKEQDLIMTGVHPPLPHPSIFIWQNTEIGFESMCNVTSLSTVDLLKKIVLSNVLAREILIKLKLYHWY